MLRQIILQAQLTWDAQPHLQKLLPRARFHGGDFFQPGVLANASPCSRAQGGQWRAVSCHLCCAGGRVYADMRTHTALLGVCAACLTSDLTSAGTLPAGQDGDAWVLRQILHVRRPLRPQLRPALQAVML